MLIVEVSNSSLEYDTTSKLQLYAITGVAEYWVADLENERVVVDTNPSAIRIKLCASCIAEIPFAPILLPDCCISVDILLL